MFIARRRYQAMGLDLETINQSVTKLRADIPEDAFTAGILGSQRVGNGVVPAFYSGSPELARTVNLVRLTAGGVVVTREALIWRD